MLIRSLMNTVRFERITTKDQCFHAARATLHLPQFPNSTHNTAHLSQLLQQFALQPAAATDTNSVYLAVDSELF